MKKKSYKKQIFIRSFDKQFSDIIQTLKPITGKDHDRSPHIMLKITKSTWLLFLFIFKCLLLLAGHSYERYGHF